MNDNKIRQNGCDYQTDIPQVARYLQLDFEGYFMNRLATDPDPTDDPYGTSGYTMALGGEPVLDQKIRLQYDAKQAPLRSNGLPQLSQAVQKGVEVTRVLFNGEQDDKLSALFKGAKVDLLAGENDNDAVLPGPTFVSNNNTVGSDDTMAFVVEPFILHITKDGKTALEIKAVDHIIPGKPDCFAIDVAQPKVYARRLSQPVVTGSDEAHQAIGVYDEYGYFRDRRQWLREQIEKGELALLGDCQDREALALQVQNYQTRLFQLESWGNRVINKLGFLSRWSHKTNGKQSFKLLGSDCLAGSEPLAKVLGGKVILDQPWAVEYWFGGWDGDLLTGYMRGSLSIPFTPTQESGCPEVADACRGGE